MKNVELGQKRKFVDDKVVVWKKEEWKSVLDSFMSASQAKVILPLSQVLVEPGMAPPTVIWLLPLQSLIEKMSHRLAYRSILQVFWIMVPSFQTLHLVSGWQNKQQKTSRTLTNPTHKNSLRQIKIKKLLKEHFLYCSCHIFLLWRLILAPTILLEIHPFLLVFQNYWYRNLGDILIYLWPLNVIVTPNFVSFLFISRAHNTNLLSY